MTERGNLKDEVFLRMAMELSRLGTCCRLKVGCPARIPANGEAESISAFVSSRSSSSWSGCMR